MTEQILSKTKLISFVIPVFNEEDNVNRIYDAIISLMKTELNDFDYEIIFTDNHSYDGTFELLRDLANINSCVRIIRFSKNFGYQRSIYTGYLNARGDFAVQLDADLQDPPELVPEFIKFWQQGYKVVYGVRKTRKEGWLIQTIRKIFYRLIDFLSEDSLPHDAGDFRLVDRVVIDTLREIDDYQPYLRGTIAAMGFNQIGIDYNRRDRKYGQSKFSFRSMVHLSIDAILNHSIIPLRIASYAGISISFFTLCLSLIYLFARLIFGVNMPAGFATTTILILLSFSVNALFLGIIGEYLGRIYQQVKKRPLTIIEKRINF
ncbi:glycosyltransferase family 2 protein [Spirulina sp. 06S082]|uniref:glycosyltransferase family 2 protein n=1 Tax=Spirulina sp. 06S082 TaxID=3110248 RepID=UPI002B212858|nr:glycosyltransferase family 2 protein [Spirulina sp. 06S082]MEA5468200.1 glycosyltransferase family 2 protein [Spirulina sp. 06S082]